LKHYTNQNYEQAVVWWEKSAQQGNIEAQHNVGTMYAMAVEFRKIVQRLLLGFKNQQTKVMQNLNWFLVCLYGWRRGRKRHERGKILDK
jgi:TPR repeat protein